MAEPSPPRNFSKMEELLRINKDTYLQLIKDFKPKLSQGASSGFSETDTVVAARVRPLLANEIADGQLTGVLTRPGGFLDAHELKEKPRPPPTLNSWEFQLHKSYGADQSSVEVYEDLVAPLIPWSWGGGVSTLFAYGQTGSGKTYTVSELHRLAASDLMNGKLPGNREILISAFELAGNKAFDLLNERGPLKVLEDSFGETQLLGIKETTITSAFNFISLVEKSMTFRRTVATLKNDTSSRTHAIWRIRIINKDVPETPDGLLFLIDLAGSEFARDYQKHTDAQKAESRDINMSLSTLKDCIRGRAMQTKHVPFRHSALTKVLKHVFDPNGSRACKTAVLACVSPSAWDIGPSKNTLRFAELLKVPVPPPKPVVYDPTSPITWSNAQLQKWITTKSGTPVISPAILAPTESGLQLIRLPKEVFVTRCLLTPGVTPDHARAFHSELWRLHTDARTVSLANSASKAAALKAASLAQAKQARLAEEAQARSLIPFKERMKGGMFVRWSSKPRGVTEEVSMVLAPEYSFEGGMVDTGEHRRYYCASVKRGIMQGTWEVDVREQKMVGMRDMEAEVLLLYDPATRYYIMEV